MITFSLDKTFSNDEGSEMTIDVKSDGMNPEDKIIKKQNCTIQGHR